MVVVQAIAVDIKTAYFFCPERRSVMSVQEKSGILLVDKPSGMTSHDVVAIIRRIYKTRQVGHTGTLDPMATGLLVVLVGSAVKASEYLMSDRKSYRAGLRLGITTDTEDISGNILSSSDNLPCYSDIGKCIEFFRGPVYQIPPMYSALKVGGKKLVDLARKGVEIDREKRLVYIYRLELLGREGEDWLLDVTCSKGTYIRTLCSDIGKSLGCGGTMSFLRRTGCGCFSVDDAVGLPEIGALDDDLKNQLIIPLESAFSSLPVLRLPAFYERLAKNGCEIYQKKISSSYPVGTRLRVYDGKGFFALAEICEYPAGSAVKLIKRFDSGNG